MHAWCRKLSCPATSSEPEAGWSRWYAKWSLLSAGLGSDSWWASPEAINATGIHLSRNAERLQGSSIWN